MVVPACLTACAGLLATASGCRRGLASVSAAHPQRCIGEVAEGAHQELKSPFGGRGGVGEQVGDCQSRCSLGARSMDGIKLQQTPGSVVGPPFLEHRVTLNGKDRQL